MTTEAKEFPSAPYGSSAFVEDAQDEPSTQNAQLARDAGTNDKSSTPNVRLACVEISHFRRLSAVRVAIDTETTILVGANNSGKTSILQALRQFLADNPAFGAHDLSIDQWPKLNHIAEVWEALDEDPTSDDSNPLPWDQHLMDTLACMPTLDLWFNAQPGAFHVVAPFIPSLQWSGGPVGVRLRLDPRPGMSWPG
jgi:hypothetical protein